jgi:myosin heavy subunit
MQSLEGSTVFYFHPVRAWDVGTVLGTATSAVSTGTGKDEIKVIIKDTKSGERLEVKPNLVFHPSPGVELLAPDNLLTLPELHHGILLNALKLRYLKDDCYSHIGDLVVAVNPFKFDIPWYKPEVSEQYLQHLESATIPGHIRPHTWSVAHRAYVNTVKKKQNHSVIVSGESGSGKTEACKIVLNYICLAAARHAPAEQKELTERVNRKVQQSNPILEAFGNAKTVRNDNSSRFGKFMEIQLDDKGRLVGMRVTPYLLEKSRVFTAAEDERLFHIYYQLLAGASDQLKSELKLKHVKDFKMLSSSGATVIRGVDDKAGFEEVLAAMTDLDFAPEEQATVWRVLAAILHLQNVEFTERRMDAKAEVSPASQLLCSFVCTELLRLSCNPTEFERDLTRNRKVVGKEVVYVELTKQRAEDQRDTVCKYLYTQLFFWIISKINKATNIQALTFPPLNPNASFVAPNMAAALNPGSPKPQSPKATHFIGLLDIFGFEDFQVNSFEQFCINLANEALQRHYSKFQFEKDLEDIRNEGVKGKAVAFQDNQPCLDLIMGEKDSVISMLDDRSTMDFERNKSTSPPDQVLLDLLTACHKPEWNQVSNKGIAKSVLERQVSEMKKPSDFFDRGRFDDDSFSIKHYAGTVKYKVKGFVEKNADALKDSMKETLAGSKDTCLVEMLALTEDDMVSTQLVSSPAQGATGKGKATVASRFRKSLKDLLSLLDQTSPNWIRCIRPHPKRQPGMWDGKAVLEQLVASGLLETIEQRQRNFPYRLSLTDFVARYAVISASTSSRRLGLNRTPVNERCQLIANILGVDPTHAQVGKTKMFLQADAYAKAETLRREKMLKHVHCLAKFMYMRDSRQLVALLRYQKTAKSVQRIFRLTRKFRKIIAQYYAELCERIRERHVAERKQVQAEEVKTREGLTHIEHTARMDAHKQFRVALVPMVAAVLRNIQKVEEIQRQALRETEQSVSIGFAAIFEESEVKYRELYHARKKREAEEALLRRTVLQTKENEERAIILTEELQKRQALQSSLAPSLEALHRRVERIRDLQRQRDSYLKMLAKERERELKRLEREELERQKSEADLWVQYLGRQGVQTDAQYFAKCGMSPTEAQRQVQRMISAGLPSTLIQSPVRGADHSSVRSYKDYSELWKRKYHEEVSVRGVDGLLHSDRLKTSPSSHAATPSPHAAEGIASRIALARSPVAGTLRNVEVLWTPKADTVAEAEQPANTSLNRDSLHKGAPPNPTAELNLKEPVPATMRHSSIRLRGAGEEAPSHPPAHVHFAHRKLTNAEIMEQAALRRKHAEDDSHDHPLLHHHEDSFAFTASAVFAAPESGLDTNDEDLSHSLSLSHSRPSAHTLSPSKSFRKPSGGEGDPSTHSRGKGLKKSPSHRETSVLLPPSSSSSSPALRRHSSSARGMTDPRKVHKDTQPKQERLFERILKEYGDGEDRGGQRLSSTSRRSLH